MKAIRAILPSLWAMMAVTAAATAATENTSLLDEIVVTAQRRPQPLSQVPVSLRRLDGAELAARAVPDTENALTAIANADITRTRNSGTEWNIALRGVGNAAALNIDEAVAVYIDDVFVPDSSGFNFEFADLASLEVLRGPQGILYGRNALGGAVNIRTQAPGTQPGGYVNALYGSDNEVRLGGAVDVPSADGRWRTRLSGLYARHDGRITNNQPGAKDVDSLEAGGLRLRTAYDLTDRTLVELAGDYARTDRLLGAGDMATVDDQGVTLRHPTDSQLKNGGGSLKLTHDAGPVLLKSITGLRATKGTSWGSRPETFLDDVADLDVKQHSLTQELQALSNGDGRLSWIAGLFGQDYQTRRRSTLENLDYGVGERSRSRVDGQSLGVFGQTRWAVTPALGLAVGARYTHDEKHLRYTHEGSLAPLFGFAFAPAQSLDLKRSWSGVTPEAVVDYRPLPDLMLYAKASRGYKAGGFNTEFIATDSVSYGKETLWNLETGVKAGFWDGKGLLSAALFHADWDNQQVLNFVNGQSHVANADSSRSRGGEVEVTLRPLPGLSLNAGLGYNDAGFVQFPNADAYGNDADGNRQPRAARYTGFAGFSYEQDVGGGWVGSIRADYSYRSAFYWDVQNSLREPARHLVDAGIAASRGGFTVRLFGRNLTDARYHVNAYAGSAGLFPDQATPGEGRTFGISLQQSF